MQKKPTTVDDRARDQPRIVGKALELAYRQMAREETREAAALRWAEATVGDVGDEMR